VRGKRMPWRAARRLFLDLRRAGGRSDDVLHGRAGLGAADGTAPRILRELCGRKDVMPVGGAARRRLPSFDQGARGYLREGVEEAVQYRGCSRTTPRTLPSPKGDGRASLSVL
jgi:hypothetical protein